MIGPSLMVLQREAGEEGGLHIEIRGANDNHTRIVVLMKVLNILIKFGII